MREWMTGACVFAGILAVTSAGMALPGASGAAAAPCALPVPPPVEGKPVKPALPSKPACLDAKGGCPGWETYSYNDAIKAYNGQIAAYRPLAEAYLQRLNAYVKASADYAQCEAKSL